MTIKTSKLPGLLLDKPNGPGSVPPAAAAGLTWTGTQRPLTGRPAVRPPSIARFPGLHRPENFTGIGGTAL